MILRNPRLTKSLGAASLCLLILTSLSAIPARAGQHTAPRPKKVRLAPGVKQGKKEKLKAASRASHWTDKEGLEHWKDKQGLSHWKDKEGFEHRRDRRGLEHWKLANGQTHWRDEHGLEHWWDQGHQEHWWDKDHKEHLVDPAEQKAHHKHK